MVNRCWASVVFFIAFMVNASFSLVTDFLNTGFSVVEQYVFYLIMAACSVVVALVLRLADVRMLLFIVLFFFFLVVWSLAGDPVYGAAKAFLGLIVPMLSLSIMRSRSWSVEELAGCIITTCVLVLLVALVYKSAFGFSQRSVRFGLFGSITFGWVMSFGVVASILRLKSKVSLSAALFFLVFIMAVLWSGSKGPLISLSVISFWLVLKEFSIVRAVLVLMVIALLVYLSKDFLMELRAINTLIKFADDPQGYASSVGQGSIGSRLEFYTASFEMFLTNPIVGVGFGGWGGFILSSEHFYPHNLVFEVLAEAGLIGLFFLIGVVCYIFNISSSLLRYLIVVSLLSMMFSGDFSYFRYPLFFILLMSVCERERVLSCGSISEASGYNSRRIV